MIKGIGIDIVELERIHNLLRRQPKIIDRVLTEREKDTFKILPEQRKVEFLAGRFAAKEAFSKAKGTGIGKSLSFLDMEIRQDERGKPEIICFAETGKNVYHLSISHSKEYAVAQVIIEATD